MYLDTKRGYMHLLHRNRKGEEGFVCNKQNVKMEILSKVLYFGVVVTFG